MYDVIGDKTGGDSVVYFTDPTEFEYHLTSCIVSLTFPSIQIIRNHIATIALYEHIRFQGNKIAVIKSINEHYN